MRPPEDRDESKQPPSAEEAIAASRALRKRVQADRLERKRKLDAATRDNKGATITRLKPRDQGPPDSHSAQSA